MSFQRIIRCPQCQGVIERTILGDSPGQHELWFRCSGVCGHLFPPPWPEKQWEDPSTEPLPTAIADQLLSRTPGQPAEGADPFSQTINALKPHRTLVEITRTICIASVISAVYLRLAIYIISTQGHSTMI